MERAAVAVDGRNGWAERFFLNVRTGVSEYAGREGRRGLSLCSYGLI